MKEPKCNENNIYKRVDALEAQTKESLAAINLLLNAVDRLVCSDNGIYTTNVSAEEMNSDVVTVEVGKS